MSTSLIRFFLPVCIMTIICSHYAKKCHGCHFDDETLPNHCRNCKIKGCARNRGLCYCFQCEKYPCILIKNMDRSYRKRYHVSLIEQGEFLKQHGIAAFSYVNKGIGPVKDVVASFLCMMASAAIVLLLKT